MHSANIPPMIPRTLSRNGVTSRMYITKLPQTYFGKGKRGTKNGLAQTAGKELKRGESSREKSIMQNHKE